MIVQMPLNALPSSQQTGVIESDFFCNYDIVAADRGD